MCSSPELALILRAHTHTHTLTCIVPLDGRDGNGLQGLLQEVQQTGADDHLLGEGLQSHPGVQFGRLHPAAALGLGCRGTL